MERTEADEALIALGIGQCVFNAGSDTARIIREALVSEGFARCVWAERRMNGKQRYELTDEGINKFKQMEVANGRPFRL